MVPPMTNATSQSVTDAAFTHADTLFARRYPTETRRTDAIWTAAHSALVGQRWNDARKELEALGRRTDVRDYLPSAEACGCPRHLLTVFQDRIDMVHARIE